MALVGKARQHLDDGEARMPPRLRVERRYPHQPMDTSLQLQPPESALTTDLHSGALDAVLSLERSTSSTSMAALPAHRVYIRSSIWHQSVLSSPPAPAFSDRNASASAFGRHMRLATCSARVASSVAWSSWARSGSSSGPASSIISARVLQSATARAPSARRASRSAAHSSPAVSKRRSAPAATSRSSSALSSSLRACLPPCKPPPPLYPRLSLAWKASGAQPLVRTAAHLQPVVTHVLALRMPPTPPPTE
eukprot:CAMPEP_0114632642 /NCGR_PEP_ID=MMETSP0168-20121206/15040_1 /TAXON_ID=95228 ORGANISM="Vannella sp., Strain DIVA3 517/6/12" /NCGR_SAMPLE_ID=MMETSP0168 /ASSEMBLY_ACC=CAM_ASM_000044 /LENGTH=250 /DNA_ID=CAMNT_0001844259 /DNA_START=415 /DNA_END=1168 /DNA_ORIENTATION=-